MKPTTIVAFGHGWNRKVLLPAALGLATLLGVALAANTGVHAAHAASAAQPSGSVWGPDGSVWGPEGSVWGPDGSVWGPE